MKCFMSLFFQIDFNFETRDWMTVKPDELPTGSKLVTDSLYLYVTSRSRFVLDSKDYFCFSLWSGNGAKSPIWNPSSSGKQVH